MFLLYISKMKFLGTTNFGGHKKIGGNCSRMSPVVRGLFVHQTERTVYKSVNCFKSKI